MTDCTITDDERAVMRCRFSQDMTLIRTGVELNMSRATVARIQASALDKLRLLTSDDAR